MLEDTQHDPSLGTPDTFVAGTRLAWTLLWALLMGEWQLHQRKPSPLKKHGRTWRISLHVGVDEGTDQVVTQIVDVQTSDRCMPKQVAQQYEPILRVVWVAAHQSG